VKTVIFSIFSEFFCHIQRLNLLKSAVKYVKTIVKDYL